jgi:hypothetical protein
MKLRVLAGLAVAATPMALAQQWGTIPGPTGATNLSCVWGRSPTQVYAGSGVDNKVYVYDGSGWTAQVTPIGGAFVAGITGDLSTTFACGGFSAVCSAPASSATWTSINASPISAFLHGVWRGSGITYAVGGGGRYGFGGSGAWTGVGTSLTSTTWRGVTGASTSYIAVGDFGNVITGGSTSWNVRPSNTTSALFAVTQAGSIAVAVGADARVIVSTNAGAGWSVYNHAFTTNTLRGVSGAGSTFIAVGDGGVILRSVNSGATWTIDASGTTANLTGVWLAADGSRAYAVASDGSVHTWPSPPPGAFSVISPADGRFVESPTPTIVWSASTNAFGGYSLTLDDAPDFATPLLSQTGLTGTSLAVPAGLLSPNSLYYLRLQASSTAGTTQANPTPSRFAVVAPVPGCDPDFNRDGNVDQDDVTALINVIAGGDCP